MPHLLTFKKSENIDSILRQTAREGGMCIEIFDENGNELNYVEAMPMGIIRDMSLEDKKRLYNETVSEGTKIYFDSIGFYNRKNENYSGQSGESEKRRIDMEQREFGFMDEEQARREHFDEAKIIVYSQKIKFEDKDAILVLSTALTPLFATREILNVETIYICGALLVVAVLLSFLIYRKISKPIMRTNQKAMLLAGGNYDVSFDLGGYREIDELNKTLQFAASELNKTKNLRRELIANVSHDLRTPLTMIRGYAELMRDIPGEDCGENLQIIIDETNRLSNLVTDMLDLSKLQSGVMELNRQEMSITENIEGTLLKYRKIKSLEGYDIIFERDCDVYINADSLKMSQVLYNLINNAINYTGEDKRIVIRQLVKNNTVRIEIEDTGEGIDEKDIKLIWDRYYKADKNFRRPASGTGLGLSIVKNILELHGFDYGIESQKGKGSMFYFSAPVSRIRNDKMQ